MQFFVVSMLLLVVLSTALDMLHKNVVYFLEMPKKQKNQQKLIYQSEKKQL